MPEHWGLVLQERIRAHRRRKRAKAARTKSVPRTSVVQKMQEALSRALERNDDPYEIAVLLRDMHSALFPFKAVSFREHANDVAASIAPGYDDKMGRDDILYRMRCYQVQALAALGG